MKTSDILRKAADHMERVGFHKNEYYPGWDDQDDYDSPVQPGAIDSFRDSPCCVWGAMYAVNQNDYELTVAGRMFEQYLPQRYRLALDKWNDTPSRRKGEVIAKLREVADALDAA